MKILDVQDSKAAKKAKKKQQQAAVDDTHVAAAEPLAEAEADADAEAEAEATDTAVTDAPPGTSNSGATFASLGLSDALCEACASMNFKAPSPIQREAIPWALQGRDIIGLAETGSGKTAAFALPVLHKLLEAPQPLFALVVAPTRELAFQIGEQFEALGSTIGVNMAGNSGVATPAPGAGNIVMNNGAGGTFNVSQTSSIGPPAVTIGQAISNENGSPGTDITTITGVLTEGQIIPTP